jgi:hypothetical protein
LEEKALSCAWLGLRGQERGDPNEDFKMLRDEGWRWERYALWPVRCGRVLSDAKGRGATGTRQAMLTAWRLVGMSALG